MKDKDDKKQEEKIDETDGTASDAANEKSEKEETFVKQEEFDAVKDLVGHLENNYKRALADYQNLQKRVTEEKGEWIRAANKDLLLRLLPVLDTLMMVEKHLQDPGLKVSINQFLDIVKVEGVTRIKTVGEAFDPYTMECVTTEEGEEGKVLEELRAGYMLYNKVLRAAQVKVGKK